MGIGGATQTMMSNLIKQAIRGAMAAIAATMLALAMAPSGAAAAACPLMIVKCGCMISSSGNYMLNGPNPMLLKSTEGTVCVHITADDVTLTGGSTLKGPGSKTDTVGVHVDIFAHRVTLQSVEVTGFGRGILIDGPNATVQEAVTSLNNRGTVVNGTHALLVKHSSQQDGAAGVQVNDTAKNFGMMSGTASDASGTGIVLNGASGAFLNSIVANENSSFGIWLKNATNNLITGFETEDNGTAGVYLGCNADGPNGKSSCATGSNGNTLVGPVFESSPSIVSSTGNLLLPQQSYGIAVGLGNLDNHFLVITGMGNVVDDALDENPNCGTNRWLVNDLKTSSPAKTTTYTCLN